MKNKESDKVFLAKQRDTFKQSLPFSSFCALQNGPLNKLDTFKLT